MEYDPERSPSYMPPGEPWQELSEGETPEGYLSYYYSEDDISQYPVREVGKISDMKADPNFETMSYGLCSTCSRKMRAGIVKNNNPYIFFFTNFNGERVLTGFYHIEWYTKGPPMFANIEQGNLQDDYRLVADKIHFIYPPITFNEIAEDQDYHEILNNFRNVKGVPESRVVDLLSLLESKEDRTKKYIQEVRRLERVNKRFHEYRYPTWERSEAFSLDTVENYVITETDWDYDELKSELTSVTSKGVSEWYCIECGYDFENESPLRLCPNCDKVGTLIPKEAWQNLS